VVAFVELCGQTSSGFGKEAWNGCFRRIYDDVSGGTFWPDGSDHQLFANGFETQSAVAAQPILSLPISVGGYAQGKWYLERAESLFTIQKVPFAHSGSSVGVANASLN
jgi:hypothetical protein